MHAADFMTCWCLLGFGTSMTLANLYPFGAHFYLLVSSYQFVYCLYVGFVHISQTSYSCFDCHIATHYFQCGIRTRILVDKAEIRMHMVEA